MAKIKTKKKKKKELSNRGPRKCKTSSNTPMSQTSLIRGITGTVGFTSLKSVKGQQSEASVTFRGNNERKNIKWC